MDNNDKKNYVTGWEVYVDMKPEDEEILYLLENMGYYN